MNLKKTVQVGIKDIHWSLSGPIEKAIELLKDLKNEADEKGVKYFLSYETEYACFPGDDDRNVIKVFESRLETDAEYEERIAKEKASSEALAKRKREQFEQLKKELGE